MNIWFVLWLLLAVSLLGFFAWTFLILMRQKSAWKIYAQKRKMRFRPGTLMNSPEMQGAIGDHTVSVFTSEHISPDIRGSRKLTAIEVSLSSTMPVSGAVASGGMVPLVKELGLKQELRPKYDAWNPAYIAACNNRHVLSSYLNDTRLEALCGLMKDRMNWVIFVFRDEAMLLRVDTVDPLDNPKKLDDLIKAMLNVAKALELKPGEGKRLKSEMTKTISKNVELDVDDQSMEIAADALQLEEDAEHQESDISEIEKP